MVAYMHRSVLAVLWVMEKINGAWGFYCWALFLFLGVFCLLWGGYWFVWLLEDFLDLEVTVFTRRQSNGFSSVELCDRLRHDIESASGALPPAAATT